MLVRRQRRDLARVSRRARRRASLGIPGSVLRTTAIGTAGARVRRAGHLAVHFAAHQCAGNCRDCRALPVALPPARVPIPVTALLRSPPSLRPALPRAVRSAPPSAQTPRRLHPAGSSGGDSPFALYETHGHLDTIRRLDLTPDASLMRGMPWLSLPAIRCVSLRSCASLRAPGVPEIVATDRWQPAPVSHGKNTHDANALRTRAPIGGTTSPTELPSALGSILRATDRWQVRARHRTAISLRQPGEFVLTSARSARFCRHGRSGFGQNSPAERPRLSHE